MSDKEEKDKNKDVSLAAEMALDGKIQVEGEAASQIIQAYKGKRFDSSGKELLYKGRSFKDIKNYKINPEYKSQNIKQQSGFDAELIEESRRNKNIIRNGGKERVSTTDGIGLKNDVQYDHVVLDEKGNIIPGSESQMKFYSTLTKNGKTTYKVIDKIANDSSWERYDKAIDIPSEQYEGAKKYAENKAEEFRKQAESARKLKKFDRAEALDNRADQYENASKKIRKSDVSTQEALLARTNPEKFVAKEVLVDSNIAGVEAAKGAMIFGTIINGAQAVYSAMSDEKDIGEALMDAGKETAKTGIYGYGVGSMGTALKATMHSSKSELMRRCSNTSLPTVMATSVIEVGKSFKRYAKNEIDELQLVEELGQKGVGMLASGYGSSVGVILGGAVGSVLPVVGTSIGAAIGGFVGSVVGYSVSGSLYQGTQMVLKEVEISEERRRIIEQISKEAISQNNNYIDELNIYLVNFKEEIRKNTGMLLKRMNESIMYNNIEMYAKAIEEFGRLYNLNLEYATYDEFELAMESEDKIII